MYHVKEIPNPPPGGLDMNIADEEEFSPDKLRSNIERLYMTIVGTHKMGTLVPSNLRPGHWYDGIWQAHCATPILARNSTNSLVLLCILPCVDL
jgi:hypothetical protein